MGATLVRRCTMSTQEMETLAKMNGGYAYNLLCYKQLFGDSYKMGCLMDDGTLKKVGTFKELHEIGWCGPGAIQLDIYFKS